MKRKVVALVASMTVLVGLSTSALVRAEFLDVNVLRNVVAVSNEDEIINESRRLLDEALAEKKFYKFNFALASINKIKDENVKGMLMGQLNTIATDVYSNEINKYIAKLINLVETDGSGELYDEIEVGLRKSTLDYMDREYLLGELTGWGKKLVYTTDYQNAVDKVVYAWNMLTNGTEANINSAISDAERAINSIRNKHSREYLSGQLRQIKEQTEFTIVEIN